MHEISEFPAYISSNYPALGMEQNNNLIQSDPNISCMAVILVKIDAMCYEVSDMVCDLDDICLVAENP